MDYNRVIQAAWVRGWGDVDIYGGLFRKVLSIRESLISSFFDHFDMLSLAVWQDIHV